MLKQFKAMLVAQKQVEYLETFALKHNEHSEGSCL